MRRGIFWSLCWRYHSRIFARSCRGRWFLFRLCICIRCLLQRGFVWGSCMSSRWAGWSGGCWLFFGYQHFGGFLGIRLCFIGLLAVPLEVSFLDGVSQWYQNLTVVGEACGCFVGDSFCVCKLPCLYGAGCLVWCRVPCFPPFVGYLQEPRWCMMVVAKQFHGSVLLYGLM